MTTETTSNPFRGREQPAAILAEIIVEEGCREHPLAKEIIKRAGLPVRLLANDQSTGSADPFYAQNLSQGKRQLVLARNKGKFLKSCPGTREYLCCGYQVLNIGMNCPMDCVYCILQAYLNNPRLSFFIKIEDMLVELTNALGQDRQLFWRIGTGEFTDSLVLDRLTGLSRILVEFMRDQPNGVLELKTKTVEIDNLATADHGGRTIVSWSLNSPWVIDRHELRAAPLSQRLSAAARCVSWGYNVAFHFDPLIYYPGWEEGYEETVQRLFEAVPRERIAWISMGALRFLPSLRSIVATRFPNVSFFCEEFVPGLDGKSRYFRTRRVALYRHLLQLIKRHAHPATCLYLCMESREIWQEVFGYSPEDQGGLSAMLDRAAGWTVAS